MQVQPIKTRIFKEGDTLFDFIIEQISTLQEEDVLVVTSKIMSIAEGQILPLPETEEEKDKIIQNESEFSVKTKWCWLTIKDGLAMPNAGADESNADGKFLLLPKDSFHSAKQLREQLMKHYGLKKLGVVITDSRIIQLRKGTIGVALGYAGFKGLKNYVGTQDLFGRELQLAQANIADGLAGVGVFVMGEGNESIPLALIKDVDIDFTNEEVSPKELSISREDDLYGALFKDAM